MMDSCEGKITDDCFLLKPKNAIPISKFLKSTGIGYRTNLSREARITGYDSDETVEDEPEELSFGDYK